MIPVKAQSPSRNAKTLYRRLAEVALPSRRRQPLVFMHIPKTGGTSLEQVLARLYPSRGESNLSFGAVTQAWQLARSYAPPGAAKELTWFETINQALCYKIARGAPFLSGHFGVTLDLLERVQGPRRFITLLRDPYRRWKSNYIYSRIRQAQDGQREPPADLDAELAAFLDGPTALREGAKYVRYLGGFRQPEGERSRAAIDEAKRVLARFDVVGTLERMEAFEQRLSALLQASIRVPHLRKTETFREPGGRTRADYEALFTPQVEERVRDLCQPDYELYRFAQSLSSISG